MGNSSIFDGKLHKEYEIDINYICKQCSKSYSLSEIALGEKEYIKEKKKIIEEIELFNEEVYDKYKKGNKFIAKVIILGFIVLMWLIIIIRF